MATKTKTLSVPQIAALLLLADSGASVSRGWRRREHEVSHATDNPAQPYRCSGDTINGRTLDALDALGLVEKIDDEKLKYDSRWRISDAGRVALAAADVGAKLEAAKTIEADRAGREYHRLRQRAHVAARDARLACDDAEVALVDAVRAEGYRFSGPVYTALERLAAADRDYDARKAELKAVLDERKETADG